MWRIEAGFFSDSWTVTKDGEAMGSIQKTQTAPVKYQAYCAGTPYRDLGQFNSREAAFDAIKHAETYE